MRAIGLGAEEADGPVAGKAGDAVGKVLRSTLHVGCGRPRMDWMPYIRRASSAITA